MQTFLPYPDFAESARVLDRYRLGKQRVEAKQIYRAITDPSCGWQNHPAVRMWRGYHTAIAVYGLYICAEWASRGYYDTLSQFFAQCIDGQVSVAYPPWLGDPAFHRSHQSNLIRKVPEYYGDIFPGVPDNLPYVWPDPATYKRKEVA